MVILITKPANSLDLTIYSIYPIMFGLWT
uniref:Uncharacterized protein n=1 Tax=Arundo donax TaxID=35708 RepID=A0A0A8XYA3_ARUDO